MSTGCLRQTELPQTTPLFVDFLYQFERVARFYEHNPWDADSYRRAAETVDFPAERRRQLVDVLAQQNDSSNALDRLAQPRTVAVVTGQQVGLFSGPCYTIYKALTAARLAARLTESGVPAVPVFWLATEDHDFEEVNHAWTFSPALEPSRQQIDSPSGANSPVGGIGIPSYPIEALRRSLDGFPFSEEVLGSVERAYKPGATLGEAFQSLLKELLSQLGLLYIDPMSPAIRRIAAPLVAQAVQSAPMLAPLLAKRNTELQSAGYHAQVHIEPKTSLVFLLEDGRRVPLRQESDGYVGPSRHYSPQNLAGQAEHLSPNVLLRPVVQDYLLPSVALIGGPAELAYLAQTHVVYRELGRPMPVVAPRAGFTLLDARAVKLMSRYGLSAKDCFDGIEPLREKIAGQLVPPAIRRSLDSVRASTADTLDRLGLELAGFDATLAAALDKSRAKILYQLSKIQSKTIRQTLRREERARIEADYLHNLICHEKHLQERRYTILPFLAKHGTGLISRLYDSIHLDCPDHIVLPL